MVCASRQLICLSIVQQAPPSLCITPEVSVRDPHILCCSGMVTLHARVWTEEIHRWRRAATTSVCLYSLGLGWFSFLRVCRWPFADCRNMLRVKRANVFLFLVKHRKRRSARRRPQWDQTRRVWFHFSNEQLLLHVSCFPIFTQFKFTK